MEEGHGGLRSKSGWEIGAAGVIRLYSVAAGMQPLGMSGGVYRAFTVRSVVHFVNSAPSFRSIQSDARRTFRMEAPVEPDSPAELRRRQRPAQRHAPAAGRADDAARRAAGCEIRLNVDGVQPLHAALVNGQGGYFLRDLAGEGDVLLNDQPAALAQVQDGDVVSVGFFRFRLQLTNPPPGKAAETERNALRFRPPRSRPSSRR